MLLLDDFNNLVDTAQLLLLLGGGPCNPLRQKHFAVHLIYISTLSNTRRQSLTTSLRPEEASLCV